MKTLFITLLLSITLTGTSIYDFKVPGLDGKEIDFSKYKGKKIMIVNTASNCGNTPQYAELEKFHKGFGDKVVVVGFPANNFGGQEPGSNSEIKEFCTKNYGVTFPMAEKISVKGDDIHPLYKWLVEQSQKLAEKVPETDQAKRKLLAEPVKWNFAKFLINEKGELIAVFHHKTSVLSEEVNKYLN